MAHPRKYLRRSNIASGLCSVCGQRKPTVPSRWHVVQAGNAADASAKKVLSEWVSTVSSCDGFLFPASVGRFRPNSFGLYDMHGNACEWCADWISEHYYGVSPTADPMGPESGKSRVVRGGSWRSSLKDVRSAGRTGDRPSNHDHALGFRVSRAL